ncbi:MAG: hypothetical protein FVQ81_12105 [Candidatus Glassbacteria bacterium]|nr:hypothetical protein [Candidatus Glassbacteria bacterium]
MKISTVAVYTLCIAVTLTLPLCSCSGGSDGDAYSQRWVYASRGLHSDSDVEDLRRIVTTAGEHGLNGILLSAGFDRLEVQPDDYFQRLEQVKQICAENGIEIIPILWSAGYGSSVLAHNNNLGAGLPVRDALFQVRKRVAELIADPAAEIVNGGFEQWDGERAAGFSKPEQWGAVAKRDTETVKEGGSSLRFSDFAGQPAEAGRLGQVIAVAPYRCYRVSCWVKTEGLDAYGPFSSSRFRLEVLATSDNRRLQFLDPVLPPTTDGWQLVQLGFNSWGYEEVEISPRAVGGREGKGAIWLDGLKIEEMGPINILRRPGTPLKVVDATDGTEYSEGTDFAELTDPQLNYAWDHEAPRIEILPGGRIRDGAELRVSWYYGASVNRRQVSACMSEPETYDIWRREAALLVKHLNPRRWFLSMDEVRSGGTCAACAARNTNMGEIFGRCVARQYEIIQQASPGAEVFVWSDQLDPNHNAGSRSGEFYYLNSSLFDGSWNFIPEDLIIACWWHRMRNESLAHFSGLGFRTLGASYYDADDLENPKNWLVSLDQTPGALGVMYTSWQNKYELLDEFGDLVSGHVAKAPPLE